jgi:hypothetical protein
MTAFDKAWGVVKKDVKVSYHPIPDDRYMETGSEGEYRWDCPHCGSENQEWSPNQSPMSPFRFHDSADVKCAACGEEVGISETGAFDGPWDECVGCGLAHTTPDSDYCSEECQSQNRRDER